MNESSAAGVVDLKAYFERIGYSGPRAPTLPTLRAIQDAHVRAIPFENLDSLGGLVVAIDLRSVESKLVGAARGGYCYEHNMLLWSVLEQLGFSVNALAARVRWQVPADVVAPLSHMALRVEVGLASYLVDAGFGGLSLTTPLDLAVSGAQPTAMESCRLTPADGGWTLEAELGGQWTPLYRFDLTNHPARDFEVFNWYACTSPRSLFVGSLMAASLHGSVRHTLRNNRLTTRELGGEARVRRLDSAEAILEVLAGTMGIRATRSPGLMARLEALAALP